jgi:hypothetical protein
MTNAHLANNQLNPPVILVQTWCLLSRDEDDEVSQHALKMLLETFGDMKSVIDFVKVNNIRVG